MAVTPTLLKRLNKDYKPHLVYENLFSALEFQKKTIIHGNVEVAGLTDVALVGREAITSAVRMFVQRHKSGERALEQAEGLIPLMASWHTGLERMVREDLIENTGLAEDEVRKIMAEWYFNTRGPKDYGDPSSL